MKVFALEEAELATRIAEGITGRRRPAGATAEQALSAFAPEDRQAMQYAARNCMAYLREQMLGCGIKVETVVQSAGQAGHA